MTGPAAEKPRQPVSSECSLDGGGVQCEPRLTAQGWSEHETLSWAGKGTHLMAALLTRQGRRGIWGIGLPGGIPVTARVGVLRTPGLSATDDVLREASTVTRLTEGARLEQRVSPLTHKFPRRRWGAVLSPEKTGEEAGHKKSHVENGPL